MGGGTAGRRLEGRAHSRRTKRHRFGVSTRRTTYSTVNTAQMNQSHATKMASAAVGRSTSSGTMSSGDHGEGQHEQRELNRSLKTLKGFRDVPGESSLPTRMPSHLRRGWRPSAQDAIGAP